MKKILLILTTMFLFMLSCCENGLKTDYMLYEKVDSFVKYNKYDIYKYDSDKWGVDFTTYPVLQTALDNIYNLGLTGEGTKYENIPDYGIVYLILEKITTKETLTFLYTGSADGDVYLSVYDSKTRLSYVIDPKYSEDILDFGLTLLEIYESESSINYLDRKN